MTAYTFSFAEIDADDKQRVGGKGHSLSLLARLDVQVPPGFVVSSEVYGAYLQANRIDLQDDTDTVTEKMLNGQFPPALAAEIEQRIQALGVDYLAVRSSSISEDSADKSFAGMFESYLNVRPEEVLHAIKRCYVSTLSERVRHYRDQEEAIAVVVQAMVDAEAAGVLFTRHPLSGEDDVLVVEACPGLGEPLVSGNITPDFYLLDKLTGTLLDKRKHQHSHKLVRVGDENQTLAVDGTELKLNACHLRQLAACAQRIEAFYGFPCDIEWCMDNAHLYIVQSRPITAVAKSAANESHRAYHKRFSARILSPVFEEANVKGFARYSQAQFELPFSLAGYHLYQPSVLHPNGEVDIWVHDGLDQRLKIFLKKMLRRDIGYLKRIEQRYLDLVAAFTEFTEGVEATDFSAASPAELSAKLQTFDALNQRMTSIYNAPIFILGALGEVLLEEMRVIDAEQADSDFITLTLSCIQNPVLQRDLDMNRIHLTATLKYKYQLWSEAVPEEPEIKRLLAQYEKRWRFLGCTDVIGEAFERKYFIEQLKQQFAKDPRAEFARLQQQTQQEYREFSAVARKYQRLSYEITWMRKWLYYRNNTTEHYYRDFQALKPLWLAIAPHLDLSYRNLLNLGAEEMITGLRQDNVARIREAAVTRNREGFSCEQRGSEVILQTGVEFEQRIEKKIPAQDEMQGQIANSGVAEGTVKIIRDPVAEANNFADNDILVTGMTTPSFLPLMEKAAGIITDEGGILCHAALVSREIGKPCLIAVANATQILKNHDRVRLDCNEGFVKILKE